MIKLRTCVGRQDETSGPGVRREAVDLRVVVEPVEEVNRVFVDESYRSIEE